MKPAQARIACRPANTRGSRGMPPRKISYENQIASLSETYIWGHSVLDWKAWNTCNSGYRHAAARIYFNSIAISAFRYTAACMAIIIQLHEVAMIILFRTVWWYHRLSRYQAAVDLQFHFRINDTPAEGSSLLASILFSSLSYHDDYRFILSISRWLFCDLYWI